MSLFVAQFLERSSGIWEAMFSIPVQDSESFVSPLLWRGEHYNFFTWLSSLKFASFIYHQNEIWNLYNKDIKTNWQVSHIDSVAEEWNLWLPRTNPSRGRMEDLNQQCQIHATLK